MTRDEVIKWFGDLGWPVARMKRGLPVRSDKFEVRTGKMKLSIRKIVDPRPVKFRRGRHEYYAPYPLLESVYYGELSLESWPYMSRLGPMLMGARLHVTHHLNIGDFVYEPFKATKKIECDDEDPSLEKYGKLYRGQTITHEGRTGTPQNLPKRVGVNGVTADPIAYVIRFGSSSKAYMTHEAMLDTRLQQLRKRKVRFSIEPLYRFPEV